MASQQPLIDLDDPEECFGVPGMSHCVARPERIKLGSVSVARLPSEAQVVALIAKLPVPRQLDPPEYKEGLWWLYQRAGESAPPMPSNLARYAAASSKLRTRNDKVSILGVSANSPKVLEEAVKVYKAKYGRSAWDVIRELFVAVREAKGAKPAPAAAAAAAAAPTVAFRGGARTPPRKIRRSSSASSALVSPGSVLPDAVSAMVAANVEATVGAVTEQVTTSVLAALKAEGLIASPAGTGGPELELEEL